MKTSFEKGSKEEFEAPAPKKPVTAEAAAKKAKTATKAASSAKKAMKEFGANSPQADKAVEKFQKADADASDAAKRVKTDAKPAARRAKPRKAALKAALEASALDPYGNPEVTAKTASAASPAATDEANETIRATIRAENPSRPEPKLDGREARRMSAISEGVRYTAGPLPRNLRNYCGRTNTGSHPGASRGELQTINLMTKVRQGNAEAAYRRKVAKLS